MPDHIKTVIVVQIQKRHVFSSHVLKRNHTQRNCIKEDLPCICNVTFLLVSCCYYRHNREHQKHEIYYVLLPI